MEITSGRQVDIESLSNTIIDLYICAENHEARSYTFYNSLNKETIKEMVILCYKDTVVAGGVKIRGKVKITNHHKIIEILDDHLLKLNKNEVTIVVDYSCMTKPWYYSIILYLKNKNFDGLQTIHAYFNYTPSKFYEPQEPKPNNDIGPLPGKYIVPTDKPKALIVCLGYEQNKAEGIIEHLDPKTAYLLYTKPAADQRFVEKLESNNGVLLKERANNIITYPFNDLLNLERALTSLYYSLKSEYSIIIAPLGPKPFTFISMLMAAKYSDIDIWRVGSGYDINEYENEPIDDMSFLICHVQFDKENN